jgi:hypothetical protein
LDLIGVGIMDVLDLPTLAKHDIRRTLFISAVLEFWKLRKNTYDIARFMACREHEAERALHEGLEIERRRKVR